MAKGVSRLLGELVRRKGEYGEGAGGRKLGLLKTLAKRRVSTAREVVRLHEALCFLRAYPDDAEVLGTVEGMLGAFGERGDVRRHRKALVNSGIAGTEIHFEFFAETAGWLARKWGEHLSIDWEAFEGQDELEELLVQLALYCETPGLDEFAFEAREWIERMRGPKETDAAFVLRRMGQLGMSSSARESLLEGVEMPFRLSAGKDTPARTREKYEGLSIAYQRGPLGGSRGSVSAEVDWRPVSVRAVSRREGRRVIDLARAMMVARDRDLNAFAYGDANDVRLVDCGGGLQFAYVGVIAERRFLLETLYGFVMLKNGVPVGYGTNLGLFGSSEIAFTVFDTFRAGEAGMMYGRLLAITRELFGADTFTVDPYQTGEDNEDAIRSGAWWFYQKLGFRPRDASALRTMRRELRRKKADRSHRCGSSVLKKLASVNLFLDLRRPREDVLGVMCLGNVGLRVTEYVSERFGHDRRRAARECSRGAARVLGVRGLAGFSPGERLAWERWGPVVMVLPGVERWPREEKRALVGVVRAKGGRRESDYLLRFDGHRRLRRAIWRLAQAE